MAKKGGMFHYADGIDKLLMLCGTIGCIGDGLMSPLTMIILGGIIDEYGGGEPNFTNDVVDKVCIFYYFKDLCEIVFVLTNFIL